MSSTLKASRHIPYCKKLGIEYMAAAGKPQHGVQGFLVTCGGTGTDAVNLATLGYKKMWDASYAVIVTSEAGTAVLDESTKTTSGFNLISGALNEVANVVVIGRFADQA